MILVCHQCNRSWRYGCDPCGEQFASYHQRETGHHVTNAGKATRFGAYEWAEKGPIPADFPDWMRRTEEPA